LQGRAHWPYAAPVPRPLPPAIAAALSPTVPAAALACMPLLWRGLGWWLRDAFGQSEFAWRDAAKGIAWDLALVACAVALARFAGTLRVVADPARTARDARLGRRVPLSDKLASALGSLLLVAVASAAVYSVVARGMDTAYCYLTQSHWASDGFLYLDPGWAARLLDPPALVVLAVAALMAAAAVHGLRSEARMAGERSQGNPVPARATAMALVALTGAAAGWAVRDGVEYPADLYELRLVPEVNLVRQWRLWTLNPRELATEPPPLSDHHKLQFTIAGLIPDLAADPMHPLAQERLDEAPVPFPVRKGMDPKSKPNVVLTVVESLNALWVHELSGHYRGLMPETGALTRQMTVAGNYWGTSSPTIAGLITALCSLHPPSHPRDLQVGELADGNTAYTCLPDLLRQHGYRTVFVQSTSLDVMGLEHFLRTHGVDEVHGRQHFEARFAGQPSGPWGMYDSAVSAYTQEQIERLEAQRQRDGRPYFLVNLTLETHEPGMAPAGTELPKDVTEVPDHGGARKLLAAYGSTDKALGSLGRFLLAPARKDRTMWLVTGDHAQFSTVNSRPLFPTPRDAWPFAPLVFLLWDPLHDLPPRVDTLTGTQDLAPTVLHLLGLHDVKHNFMGHSLFGTRKDFPVLVGRIGQRFAFLATPAAQNTLPIGEVRRRCKQKERVLKTGLEIVDACGLAAWLDWQDGLWDSRLLFPRLWFQGDKGADKLRLRARVELNDAEKRALGVADGGTEDTPLPLSDDATPTATDQRR
jgi:arylsulfatase A-like enzyme